jgi:hypothetical protein
MAAHNIPQWNASGDWFDVCKCNIPCPCEFAQTPTYGDCDGVLAYHIKKGQYGEVPLDGLNVLGLAYFKGNIWAGATKITILCSLTNELISNREKLYRCFQR